MPGSAEDLRVNVGDTVHFEFNASDVRDDRHASVLQRQAAWLAEVSARSGSPVEGHCDERGTREYNLALGERRATAVKNVSRQRSASRRIASTTISYGKERPVCGRLE